MNTKNLFALDFTKSSIVASATTLRKARNPESPECKALQQMMAEYPGFHVRKKKINKKNGKQTYKGLTFQAMTDYIKTQANSEAEIRKYEVVRHIAKIKGSEYALTKKWFFECLSHIQRESDCGAGNGRNASSRKNAHFSVAHSRWTLMQGGQENA